MLQETLDLIEDEDIRRRCAQRIALMCSHVDFWPFGGEIHQQRHWARVLVLATQIGIGEGFSKDDLDALGWAAIFHDTRRRDGFLDRGHGDRGAEHYREFCEAHGVEMDPRAYLAIKWHDRDDAQGDEAIAEWQAGHDPKPGWKADALALYHAFKDADGLDRIRMGDWALDTKYLRLSTSKHLLGFAHDLLDASDRVVSGTHFGATPEKYLVVVDVQNDFVSGSLGTPEAQAKLAAMAEKVRSFDGRVVFTRDTHDEGYLDTQEGHVLPVPHCIVGTEGWELAGEMAHLQRSRNLPVYWKSTFGSTELAHDLEKVRAKGGLASVELIGLCTDVCVVSNALLIRAQMPEVPVAVDASCCAGVTLQSHESALTTMASCQVQVTGRG